MPGGKRATALNPQCLRRKPSAEDVLFWLQHVNEVQSGLIDPHDPFAQPRDGYGPDDP